MKKIIFLTVLAFSLSTPKYLTWAKPMLFYLGEATKIDSLLITFKSVEIASSCKCIYRAIKAKKGYKLVIVSVRAKNIGKRKTYLGWGPGGRPSLELEVDKGYFYSPEHPDLGFSFHLLPEEVKEEKLIFQILKTTKPKKLHGRIKNTEFILPLDKITYSPKTSKKKSRVSTKIAATTIESLPYSWIEDSIMITIHGVFQADSKTKEGWVSEKDEQYKVLISYKNTSAKPYRSKYSLFEPSPGVGYLRLKTDRGNLYRPKYGGGASVLTPLAPKNHYTTHHYAFNIHKGEKPIKLCKYKDRKAEQPTIVFNLETLIPPPLLPATRIIKMRQLLKTDDFVFQPISVDSVKYITQVSPFLNSFRFGRQISRNFSSRSTKSWHVI